MTEIRPSQESGHIDSGLRGCGRRQEGGIYLMCAASPHGSPLEEFLIDPPISYGGSFFRGPMFFDNEARYVKDVVVWIGQEYYPTVPDICEEIRGMGLSKRVPRNFDFGKLTPHESRIFLLHAKAIPKFEYALERPPPCPKNLEAHNKVKSSCVRHLWPLSLFEKSTAQHSVTFDIDDPIKAIVRTPSGSYDVKRGFSDAATGSDYSSGFFAAFYITGFDYINKKDSSVPVEVAERAQKSGWEVNVRGD